MQLLEALMIMNSEKNPNMDKIEELYQHLLKVNDRTTLKVFFCIFLFLVFCFCFVSSREISNEVRMVYHIQNDYSQFLFDKIEIARERIELAIKEKELTLMENGSLKVEVQQNPVVAAAPKATKPTDQNADNKK